MAWSRAAQPRAFLPLIPLVALSVLLAACGGGNNGGGGGGGELAMKIAIVNKTDADATVSLNTVDGPTGDPQGVESCDAAVVTFPLPFEDWTLMINDQVAVDSLELDPDLIDQNLIGTININEDGSLETKTLKVGRVQQQPAQLGICV